VRVSCRISLRFDNRRHLVFAVENGSTGYIDTQPEDEVARWGGQPVGFMAWRRGVLKENIYGTVRVVCEVGTIADAISVERIRHEAILCTAHGERPERAVGREPACRKVHDVVVLAGKRVTGAIDVRPPIHRLFRYVDRTRKYLSVCGAQQHPVAGH